nr:MAG TPA: hypothetical protein [Caudoviricetes sp.]
MSSKDITGQTNAAIQTRTETSYHFFVFVLFLISKSTQILVSEKFLTFGIPIR